MTLKTKPLARRLLPVATLAAAAVLCSGATRADEPIHRDVVEAADAARTVRGAARYTALRDLWSLWDQTDPIHVEQALQALASGTTLDAPARAYAGLLGAYARRRRGDLIGAQEQVRSLGFVRDWLMVGPFDNEGRAGLAQTFGPEADQREPLDMQRSYEGKERPVRWRAVPDVFPYGWLALGDMVRPSEKVCVYATTFVRSRDGGRQASAWVGASGAFRLFWNGEEVLADELYRTLDADRFASTVVVKPGWNRLTAKVCGDEVAPMLSLRIGDGRGAPSESFEVSADPTHAEQAAKNAVTRKAGREAAATAVAAQGNRGEVQRTEPPPKRERDPGTVRGPIQLFERATAGTRPNPSELEAYAKYLLRTGGEDPSKHVARDLALRAATQRPTIERCLLAAKLAEDRNQARHWVDEAAKLPGAQQNIDLLLAQAQLARSGPNWRDAVPYYDRALAIEPDHFEALLGRVDLFNEAGLRRTALGMLEAALERNPRAVGLLRLYTLQLASLGRRTEAEEAQDRYAAYRFDDKTFQIGRIDLAVARRDKDLAKHWIDRLIATDPGGSFQLSAAARSYLALGQTQEALAAYRSALQLAPEDTEMMVELAELYGRLGQQSEQMRLLRQVLVLRPQFKDVRDYVEHIEPRQQRADEAYAWEPEQFLPLRNRASDGFNRRTLRDLQVTTVYPSGLASRFHQVVFQPLNDEAAAAGREYAFVYQADRQVVQLRAGRVFRADGRVDEAIESAVGPADNPAIAMYTSARTFYVQFPRLEVGDVVELRYRIEDITPENAFADYFGEVAFLQSSEPLRNAEYVIIAPSSRPLYFHVSPLPGFKRTDRSQGDTRIYQFLVPEVAPLPAEPKMAPWGEVLAHVHASTYQSWKDVGRWYWGLAKEQLNPDDEMRRKAEELTRGMTDPADKVRAIYDYVVQKTRYVALEFGIYGYKPRRAAQTFARGWGDCKDKAALIVSMLSVVGIPANMVIVRSSMRGSFPSEPASLAPFDHAIAYVPSLDLFLDGTAEYTGSTELSSFIRGALGLIVTPDGARLVTLPDPPAEQTQRNRTLRAKLRPDGSADLSMEFEAKGAIAAMWRSRYHADSSRRDRVAGDVSTDLPGFAMSAGAAGLSTNDLEDIEQPVLVKVQGSAPSFARNSGDSLSVPVTPRDRFVRTYAALSQRTQDLVLPYRWSTDETWTIQLPAGTKASTMPVGKALKTPYGALELTVESRGNEVVVHTKVRFDKSRITPAEYPAFVQFCEQIDRALAQKLVVAK